MGDFLCYLFGKLKFLENASELFSYSSQILVFVYLKEDKCFIIKWLHDALFGKNVNKCMYLNRWTIDEGFSILNGNIGYGGGGGS